MTTIYFVKNYRHVYLSVVELLKMLYPNLKTLVVGYCNEFCVEDYCENLHYENWYYYYYYYYHLA